MGIFRDYHAPPGHLLASWDVRDYYDRRATEYDDWYEGTGLFSSRARPGWQVELTRLVEILLGLPEGRVLDVACGTGYLTRYLRGRVVGLDQSPRMIALARQRLPEARLVRGDALALPLRGALFDRVFTGHFYGHLQPEERAIFLAEARATAPELVVVDAGPRGGEPREEWQSRILSDGSKHHVYKRFFSGSSLAQELGNGRVLHEGVFFVAVASRHEVPGSSVPAPQSGLGD
jgi:demethylmenaquinone methyltransferase/2-methoxy-6-polyprenyl-1,4-benzoquinol methylase